MQRRFFYSINNMENYTMTYDDFCRKHEPKTFADIAFADDYVGQQLEQYALRRNFDNILLYGPYGSAKTTIARMIVAERRRKLGSDDVLIHSYEAKRLESLRPIEGDIDFQLSFPTPPEPEPYVIIEEVDMLPVGLQKELRTHINTFPAGKLIMTTNERHKVDSGLLSRCDVHQVLVPPPQRYLQRALSICAAEQVHDDPALLLRVMQGSATLGSTPSLRDMMRALHKRVGWLKVNAASSHVRPPANVASAHIPLAQPLNSAVAVSNAAPTVTTLAAHTTGQLASITPAGGTP